jgi:hypothetical protein
MIDTNDKIRVDQAHVETVIPAIGKFEIFINYTMTFYLL